MSRTLANEHERYMRRCIELARRAHAAGDAHVGALVVREGVILGEGVEAVNARHDVTAHAEIEAIRAASAGLGSPDLSGCTVYTSVEPCVMCAWAIRLARVATVVSGAPEAGASASVNGLAILTAADLLPNRPIPAVVRNVLRDECEPRWTEGEPASDE